MAQLGLHAYISFKIRDLLPNKNLYFIFFLIGSMLPDIDIVLSIIISLLFFEHYNMYLFHNTITHSIISLGVIYLFTLIIYEIKKEKKILNISSGLIMGALLHIAIDILIGFESIDIFWPLPIGTINLWDITRFKHFSYILLGLNFYSLG